jgi:outer membrane protein OmpA-like peptidoglycan-associated protein
MRWCVLIMMLVAPAAAEPLIDEDPAATCRAAHAAGTADCPRHVRRRGDRIEITPLRFEFDKPILRRPAIEVVRELAQYLIAHPEIERLEIQSHNGFEDPHRSYRLSEHRARSVQDALVKHGVDPRRLEARGYGDSVPLVMPRTHADRMRNTRIELRIVK